MHLGRPRPGRMLWVTAAWGACFVAIRFGLRDAPVLWFATLRSLIAGVALVAVATAQRRPRPVGADALRARGADVVVGDLAELLEDR